MPISIPIPQIKLGKRKARSQMCEIFTEDGRSVDYEYNALHGAIQNPHLESQDAHILSVENQFYDEEDEVWKQLVNELSGVPICMIKPLDDKEAGELAGNIFEDACITAMLKKQKDAAHSQLYEKLTWIVSIVFGSFIIIAALQYFGNGGFGG